MCALETLGGVQVRSETRGWGGGQNFKMIFFVPGASWGPNFEKVDKIHTRGENFSIKKVILTISEFCGAGGGSAPWPPLCYGPRVTRIKSRETVNCPFSNAISDEDIDDIEKLYGKTSVDSRTHA